MVDGASTVRQWSDHRSAMERPRSRNGATSAITKKTSIATMPARFEVAMMPGTSSLDSVAAIVPQSIVAAMFAKLLRGANGVVMPVRFSSH
jgi:hypothetical protein